MRKFTGNAEQRSLRRERWRRDSAQLSASVLSHGAVPPRNRMPSKTSRIPLARVGGEGTRTAALLTF